MFLLILLLPEKKEDFFLPNRVAARFVGRARNYAVTCAAFRAEETERRFVYFGIDGPSATLLLVFSASLFSSATGNGVREGR